VLEATAAHFDIAFVVRNATELSALRTRLFATHPSSLLCCRFFHRSSCQALCRGHSDLLHLHQIDIKSRSIIAERTPHDDFSPTLRELLDLFEILSRQLPCTHGMTILDVKA
jgi:hypothetical protein